jgi:signal peptidase
MRIKYKHWKLLKDALTIVTLILAVVSVYFGLRLMLSTDMPLVAVASGSMKPTLQVGDLIVVQGAPASKIKVGDIIVFNPPNEKTLIIHRVTAIETLANGTTTFKTKGDANPTEDPWTITQQNIHGKALYRIPYVGYMALSPATPIAIIITIIIIILLWPEKTKRFHHKPIHAIDNNKQHFTYRQIRSFSLFEQEKGHRNS